MIPVGLKQTLLEQVEPGASHQARAPVVKLLVAACCLVFALQLPFILHGDREAAYRLALVPAEFSGRAPPLHAYPPPGATLVTSLFVHANFPHLALNMIFLYIFGRRLEARMGSTVFATLYFVSGVCASLIYVLLLPASTMRLLGASGAISGVLGAFTILFPRSRVRVLWPAWTWIGTKWHFTWTADVMAAPLLIGWLILQTLFALQALPRSAWIAHAAGFALGFMLALPFMPRRVMN